MALTLVSLKWRYFLATFKGNAWVIVGVVLGGLYGLGLTAGWTFSSVSVGLSDPENQLVAFWLVGFGSLLSLAWWLFPLFTSGTDATLDPDHLAPYPLNSRDLMVGQLLGGFVGLTGFLTLLVTLGTGFITLSKIPVLVFYLMCAAVGLILLMSVSRIVSLIAIELNAIPAVRQTLLIVGFLLMIGAGPLFMASAMTLQAVYNSLPTVAEILGWTPLASAFSAVAAAFAGNWGLALVKLGLAVVYTVCAWLIWKKLLVRAMERIGTARGNASSHAVAAGSLGIFDRFPATPTGAIAARTVMTLLKDQRVNLNVLMIPAFYVLFTVFGSMTVTASGEKAEISTNWFLMLFVPTMAGYIFAYLVSYDNSAFSMHVLSGVSGKADRWGRAWGLLLVMLPLVLAGSALMALITASAHNLVPIVALSICLLLSGVGILAVADMNISVPTPPPGASPFKVQKQSDGFAKGLMRMLIMLIIIACGLPGIILMIIASGSGSAVLGWISAAVSLVVGLAVLLIGLHLGAKAYEKHAPETLQRVSAFK